MKSRQGEERGYTFEGGPGRYSRCSKKTGGVEEQTGKNEQ